MKSPDFSELSLMSIDNSIHIWLGLSLFLPKSLCLRTGVAGVVTQTHLSRIAQKSLSVLCRVYKHSRTRKLKRAHGVLNAILVNYVKGKRKSSHEVASR